MKSKSRIALSILAVGALSLACSLLTAPTAAPPATPLVVTQPPAEVEATMPPTTEPVLPTPEPSNLPAGLATARDETITIYASNGTQVSQTQLSQITLPQRSRFHIAGPMPSNGAAVPLLYFSFENEESLHFRDGNGQIFALVNGTSFIGLTGVPGQPIVAFSQIEYLSANLRSKLYVGSIQSLPSAVPVSVIDDPESWAIKPILVDVENGTPTKVWYTRTAYGIGGDIVFEPRKGLFVLDLASGQANTLLDNNTSPWDISIDKEWVAYGSAPFSPNPICMKNLGSGAEVCFPMLPAVNDSRGSGEAVLSPNAQYVAWMEAEGSLMAEVPNFKTTVRIGQRDGTIVADLPMSMFEGAVGLGPLNRAEPVGWLDNQTVIIQVRGQEWEQVALLRYDVLSHGISYLAPGTFMGLVYP